MTITIKYFGLLADITKTNEEECRLEQQHISVAILRSQLEAKYQEMEHANYNIAVNQKMSDLNTKITEGDVVAFLPPFAGG